jgi:hypothetical protein
MQSIHQMSAIGVTASFALHPFEVNSIEIDEVNANRYVLTSKWTFLKRGASGESFIGFDIHHDYRGFAFAAEGPSSLEEPSILAMGDGLRVLPNPASREATLRLAGPAPPALGLRIAVYDPMGRRVNAFFPPDHGVIRWGLDDSRGERLSSGIYFLRLEDDERVYARGKVQILR